METIELLTAYAKMLNPFVAAILAALNTIDARRKPWRFAFGIVMTAGFLVLGLARMLGYSPA